MRTKPLKRYPTPSYPTRERLCAEPELLRHHLPAGWSADGRMAGAVAFFLALSGPGCSGPQQTAEPAPPATPASSAPPIVAITPPTSTAAAEPAPPPADAPPADAPGAMAVAPVFEHGEGRGATGCVVVAPPVFLSEEEALTVVREELARHGIKLAKQEVTFGEIHVSKRRASYQPGPSGQYQQKVEEVPGSAKALVIDALAPAQHVAVEVVTRGDYFDLGGVHSSSSVQGYELKKVATELAQRLKTEGKREVYCGVFYDPISRHDRRNRLTPTNWQAEQARLRRDSETKLRAQVRDFVGWLEQQGVI